MLLCVLDVRITSLLTTLKGDVIVVLTACCAAPKVAQRSINAGLKKVYSKMYLFKDNLLYAHSVL